MYAHFEIEHDQKEELNHERCLEIFIQMGFVIQENKFDIECWDQLWKVMSHKTKATEEEPVGDADNDENKS